MEGRTTTGQGEGNHNRMVRQETMRGAARKPKQHPQLPLWASAHRVDPYTHACEQLLVGWDPFCVTRNRGHHWLQQAHDDTTTSICSQGGSLSQPWQQWQQHNVIIIFSSCAQRSLQLWVFPDAEAVIQWEMVGLPVPADPLLMNLQVAGMVKAQVCLKVPAGYLCGSLVGTTGGFLTSFW